MVLQDRLETCRGGEKDITLSPNMQEAETGYNVVQDQLKTKGGRFAGCLNGVGLAIDLSSKGNNGVTGNFLRSSL